MPRSRRPIWGGREYDDSDIYKEEEAAVQEICERKRTMRNVGGKK